MLTPRPHRLDDDDRRFLEGVVRQKKADNLVARRANALLLLDKGWTPEAVGDALYLNAETVRGYWRSFRTEGRSSLAMKDYSQREGHLDAAQEAELSAHLEASPPRSTNAVRAHVEARYGESYSRSGAIKLLARLGFEYRKPAQLPAVADEIAQAQFIHDYEALRNGLGTDETILFVDAVHPEHQSRPAHGWFRKGAKPVVRSTSGRQRLNIHGCLDLETFAFQFVEAGRIDAKTTRHLLEKAEAAHPDKRAIHVFLDNARYHHAKVLKPWLEAPGRRVKLHFLPAYAPHLNSIENLWGVMHQHVTHNRCHASFGDFTEAILAFFRETLPQNWRTFRDHVTDNFRVISHQKHQLVQW